MTAPLDVAALLGARVRGLAEYAPEPLEVVSRRLGLPVERLAKLDAHENPYGPTPRALEALRAYGAYHQYPDAVSRDLRAALGGYLGVDPAQIVVGNGSDELIDLLLKLFRPHAEGGGVAQVIDCPPTFGMYQFYAVTNDLEVVSIPRRADFTLDVAAIEALCAADPRPRILFLASPNNPDGLLLPDADLARVLALPLVLVLDEAYVDFARASRVGLVAQHENLIVLRTFSKWAGLAGLRVGYGVFPAALMSALWRLKSPYNVNCAAQVAALATLQDMDEAQRRVRLLVAERDRLLAGIARLPRLRALPSDANFLLLDAAEIGVPTLRQAMEAHGLILRYYGGGLARYVRISVGTPAQNDAVLDVLRSLTP